MLCVPVGKEAHSCEINFYNQWQTIKGCTITFNFQHIITNC
jgi:hypothetical protein